MLPKGLQNYTKSATQIFTYGFDPPPPQRNENIPRFGLDKTYLAENHVSAFNNIGKHVGFSLARGIHICHPSILNIRSNAAKDIKPTRRKKLLTNSGNFLSDSSIISFVMGAPSADDFKVPIVLIVTNY